MVPDNADERLRVILDRGLARCVPELLAANGLRVAPVSEAASCSSSYSMAGIVGMVGDICGTLLLGCNMETLHAFEPLRSASGEPSSARQLDWIGELANQLTAQLSFRLAAQTIRFDASPPIALVGGRLRDVAGTGATCRRSFRSESGDVHVWLDVDLSEAAAGRPELYEDSDAGESPQGTIIFL